MLFFDIKSYQDLHVWNLAMQMADELYHLTSRFPAEERDGLVGRSRRASVDLVTHIAEGFTRGDADGFLEHVARARGALASVETQMLLAKQLSFAPEPDFQLIFRRVGEVSLLLRGLQKALERQRSH